MKINAMLSISDLADVASRSLYKLHEYEYNLSVSVGISGDFEELRE